MGSSKVVVGVSGSLAGLQALRYGVAEARRRECELYAVRAWTMAPSARGYLIDVCRDDAVATARAIIDETFDVALGGLPGDRTVTLVLAQQAAGVALTGVATSADDVIVIGTAHSRWGGSVGRYLLRKAVCPVVVTPPPALAGHRGSRALARELTRDMERHLLTSCQGRQSA